MEWQKTNFKNYILLFERECERECVRARGCEREYVCVCVCVCARACV
jgi:hypothetical protein